MSKDSMVMYESYYESWKMLNEIDKKYGEEFMEALFKLGLYGEVIEVSPVVRPSLAIASKLVIKATDRYAAAVENGKKGGRPHKVDYAEMHQLMKEGWTDKELAEHFNCTVDYMRKKRKERDDYVMKQKNQKNLTVTVTDTYTDTATGTDTVTDTDFLPSAEKGQGIVTLPSAEVSRRDEFTF